MGRECNENVGLSGQLCAMTMCLCVANIEKNADNKTKVFKSIDWPAPEDVDVGAQWKYVSRGRRHSRCRHREYVACGNNVEVTKAVA